MRGRHGIDQFGQFLMFVSLAFLVLGGVFRIYLFRMLAFAGLIYLYYRAFSKNLSKRQEENRRYLAETERLRFRFQSIKLQLSMRKTHKYFKCKSCKKKLRVPRGKGKIEVTCPHCGAKFIKRSGKKKNK